MNKYYNKFHQRHNVYSKEYYDRQDKFEIYLDYEIHKQSKDLYHIVKDNICVGMCAGINGAKDKIEKIIGGGYGNKY